MSERIDLPYSGKLKAYTNVRGFVSNRADFLMKQWKVHGDYYRFQLGFFDVFVVTDPEMIQEVLRDSKRFVRSKAVKFLKFVLGNGLVVADGELHRRQRRLMQPAFQPANIGAYATKMAELAEDTSAAWSESSEIEIGEEMRTLTLRVAAQTLFTTESAEMTRTIVDAIDTVLPFINRIAEPTGALQMLLPSPSNRRFKKARKDLDALIYGMIEEHRASGEDRGDLLSRLIAAQDVEGDGGGMSDEQIRDEVLTMLIAGHETTAVALSWTWYLLAKHPEVAATLHAELDRVLGGRTPSLEDVPALPYTRMVLDEVMRLYPPAYLLDRVTTEPWDNGKFTVPKGSYIFMSPYLMQRHPKYWEDPEAFRPERWEAEEASSRPKFAFFPFGGGPRICIGEHFARLEMVLVLATLAQRHALSLVSDAEVGIDPMVTLRPKGEIRMRLEARTPAAEAQPVG